VRHAFSLSFLFTLLRVRTFRYCCVKNVASRVAAQIHHRRLQLKLKISCGRIFAQFIW